MLSKLSFALVVSLLCGVETRADDSSVKEVKKALAVLNKAFEKKDGAAVKRLMTSGHISVTPYYDGPRSRAEQIASLKDLKLTKYSVGKQIVTRLSKDTVLVTYPLAQLGTFKGKPIAESCFASAVWVKQKGKWREAFYQETALSFK